MLLTLENYTQGFLMDEDLMAGITKSADAPGNFVGFVLRHTTGEYLGYQSFATIDEALAALNRIPRAWKFEAASGCSSGSCGEGKCGQGSCPKGAGAVTCEISCSP